MCNSLVRGLSGGCGNRVMTCTSLISVGFAERNLPFISFNAACFSAWFSVSTVSVHDWFTDWEVVVSVHRVLFLGCDYICHLVITWPRSQCPVCAWRGVVWWRPPRLTFTYIAVPRCDLASGGCCIHTLMPSDIYILVLYMPADQHHTFSSISSVRWTALARFTVFGLGCLLIVCVNQALSGRCGPTHRTFHALRNGRDLWS